MNPIEVKKRVSTRKKIEIKLIEKEESRHVCFSKRRQGLFKKASDLSTLCGAEVVVVVFSRAGKPYVFDNPSVDHVLGRFGPCDTLSPATTPCSELINHVHQSVQEPFWWDIDLRSMREDDLTEYEKFLQEQQTVVPLVAAQCGPLVLEATTELIDAMPNASPEVAEADYILWLEKEIMDLPDINPI